MLAEVLEVVVLALGLYLVITFAIQTVHVIGLSMYPSLHDDDYLVATKIDYRFHDPARGDVIIMRDPLDGSRDFIKRVIGLPGDQILIRDGRVFINGTQLQESYLRRDEPWTTNATWPTGAGAGQPYTLGPREYFVMGDNRNASMDSRSFGPITRDRVEARAWLRIWPIDHAGLVDRSRPRFGASSGSASSGSAAPAAPATA